MRRTPNSFERLCATTAAPASAKRRARNSPVPPLAPVTIATRPERSRSDPIEGGTGGLADADPGMGGMVAPGAANRTACYLTHDCRFGRGADAKLVLGTALALREMRVSRG